MKKLFSWDKIIEKNKTIYIISIFILIISQHLVINSNQILILVGLFCISYIIYFLYLYENKGSYSLFSDIYFIFPTIFFVYSIIAPIHFVSNGYKPIISFFYVDSEIVFKTVQVYFDIFSVISILVILFYEKINIKYAEKYRNFIYNKLDERSKTFLLFDLIASFCTIYFYFNIFKNGIHFLSLPKSQIVEALSEKIFNYNTTFMTAYSIYFIIFLVVDILDKKAKFKFFLNNIYRYVIICAYWILSLKIGIRHGFINMFLILFVYYAFTKKELSKKIVWFIFLALVGLLFLAFVRENKNSTINFMDLDIKYIAYILYMSLGEFILPQYISYFYIQNNTTLLYGKSYLITTILYLFPKFMIPFKPESLGLRFMHEAATNTGFAFNPVAEGIINFGVYASIVVPIILFGIIFLVRKYAIKFPIVYIVVCGYSISFCRGQMAISVFDIIILCLLLTIVYNDQYINDKFKKLFYFSKNKLIKKYRKEKVH